jgi:hypothetical protein
MLKKIFFILLMCALISAPTGFAKAADNAPSTNRGIDPKLLPAYEETFTKTGTISPSKLGINSLTVTSCRNYQVGVNEYNAVHQIIWTYAWTVSWCYNGSTITYVNSWRTVTINYPLWSFKGDISNQSTGGVGRTYYTHYAQGDMCLVDTGGFCFMHLYPWVNQQVYGNGSYSGSGGGG